MEKTIRKFDDIEIKKQNFYQHKRPATGLEPTTT